MKKFKVKELDADFHSVQKVEPKTYLSTGWDSFLLNKTNKSFFFFFDKYFFFVRPHSKIDLETGVGYRISSDFTQVETIFYL